MSNTSLKQAVLLAPGTSHQEDPNSFQKVSNRYMLLDITDHLSIFNNLEHVHVYNQTQMHEGIKTVGLLRRHFPTKEMQRGPHLKPRAHRFSTSQLKSHSCCDSFFRISIGNPTVSHDLCFMV